MKIDKLELPSNIETPMDMVKAQFNRLAEFIEENPKQGYVTWNELGVIGSKLVSISKDGRKSKESK